MKTTWKVIAVLLVAAMLMLLVPRAWGDTKIPHRPDIWSGLSARLPE